MSEAESNDPRASTRPAYSFSRLDRYRSCPLAFKLKYIDRLRADESEPLQFGKAVHAALEQAYLGHVLEERTSALVHAYVFDAFERAWREQGCISLSRELFCEGLDLLTEHVRAVGVVDHRDVLAIEKPFELDLGRHRVIGYIDRIDRVDDETIEIIDYKTSRQLFTKHELDDSLQLAIYEVAMREQYPWAKRVRLTYMMLRHRSLRQSKVSEGEQVEATRRYVQMLGDAIDSAEEYPARLGPNCVYCDYRKHCGAYAEALKSPRRLEVSDSPRDLGNLARERQEVAAVAKIAYARQAEIDRVIKAHLRGRDEIVVAGTRYAMLKTTTLRHPLRPTLRVLSDATGRAEDELLAELAVVDKDKLSALLGQLAGPLGSARVRMLKDEIAAVADATVSARLWAKKIDDETGPVSRGTGSASGLEEACA